MYVATLKQWGQNKKMSCSSAGIDSWGLCCRASAFVWQRVVLTPKNLGLLPGPVDAVAMPTWILERAQESWSPAGKRAQRCSGSTLEKKYKHTQKQPWERTPVQVQYNTQESPAENALGDPGPCWKMFIYFQTFETIVEKADLMQRVVRWLIHC